jgi:TRAP-type C4-dicarboxylate transport system permease small subunit
MIKHFLRPKVCLQLRIGVNVCKVFFFLAMLTATNRLFAQSGTDGIEAATAELEDYFEVGITLMYTIGAVLGLVGGVKVFQKWNSGDQDTSKVAASWFGSCIFLIVVATVLRGFFGL